jgi:hypothetical protein
MGNLTCAYRKSKSDILVVQSAENWAAKNVPGPLDGARDRRILLQGEMRTDLVVVFHVRQHYVTEIPLAEHNNMVKALRFAMGNVATSVDRECPLIEVLGRRAHQKTPSRSRIRWRGACSHPDSSVS